MARATEGVLKKLRWASGIMWVLGVGHLTLAAFMSRHQLEGWLHQGFWATVPLGKEVPLPTVDGLLNKVAFWAGPGSFSVPLFLLGGLIWHLAGRGIAVPAFVGWGIAAWCIVGGILLVPSPFFVGAVAGFLIVAAARQP